MYYNLKNERLKAFRDRLGRAADTFLIVLSVLTTVVAAGTTLVPQEHLIFPWFDTSWVSVQEVLRTITWSCFASVFAVLGGTSHRRPLDYCRKWWLELAICILWCPYLATLLQLTHSDVAVTTLTMLGVLAHFTRVSRFVIHHLGHPLVVVVVAIATVTTVGTVGMMLLEPQTYATFAESFYTLYVSSLTLGGPLNPQTGFGKLGYAMTVTAGVSVLAVYYGVIREFVHRILFKESEINEKILQQLKAKNDQLLSQNWLLTEQNMILQAQGKQIAEIKALLLASGARLPEDVQADASVSSTSTPSKAG
jgi:hypothetical protein